MICKKHHDHQKFLYILALLLSTGSLMACAKEEMIQPSDSRQITATEKTSDADSFDHRAYGSAGSTSQETTGDTQTITTTNGVSPEILADRKARFGRNCIAGQTFEVTLSEYGEKIFFVPFAPSDSNPEFHMELISDTGVLCEIPAYVPEGLAAGDFKSLDAVSFYDVNYDSHTDIVLIQTYGDRAYAAIYYGYPPGRIFMPPVMERLILICRSHCPDSSPILCLLFPFLKFAVFFQAEKRTETLTAIRRHTPPSAN